jgi:GPI mannosyltransferase 3
MPAPVVPDAVDSEGASEKRVKPAHAYPTSLHPEVLDAQTNDIFWGLILLRIANALTLATFFQPDEYYQSLEPAWSLAFGPNSGAWLTWVSIPHAKK